MSSSLSIEPKQYKRYFQKIQGVAEKTQTHEYTTAIFSFLVVSLFGWYAIRPTIQTILTLQKEIEDNKIVSQEMEDKIGKLIEAQSVYDAIQNQIPLLTETLPIDPNAVDVVRQLRNLANQSGASISAISLSSVRVADPQQSPENTAQKPQQTSPVKATGTTNIVEIPLTIALSGSFSGIQSFLKGVINMRRILTIESFNILPDSENETALIVDIPLRLVLLAKAYYITK